MVYNIEVVQYRTMTIAVEASSYEVARQKAVENAELNLDWNRVDPYYKTPDENGEYSE